VCIANLHPSKNQLALVDAMATVIMRAPGAHLILVGAKSDTNYARAVLERAERMLGPNASYLGTRLDVMSVLAGCDIGVLASTAEGLPLSLLEYGTQGLAVVATRVGQISEVLDQGRAGLLVPPNDASALAEALLDLIASSDRRRHFGGLLHQRVLHEYAAPRLLEQLAEVYRQVLI
jgi:glycosyltransferase involved in cell wall biosynthesis